jgi:hypothetical protein
MDLGRRIASRLAAATAERITGVGIENAEKNRPHIDIAHCVLELGKLQLGEGDRALVVATGPSLRGEDGVGRLARSGFTGTIIAVDSALGACLREGVVPHIVVTVDPDRERIVRWFGDPQLSAPPADDYFRRQEMDPVHARDEVSENRALVELVDSYAPRLRVAAATAASPAVVERCRTAGNGGMELYWWNPMYDDYDKPDSISRRLHSANGLPCLNGGGNVGTAAWVLSHAVLGKKRVALLGMDFAYKPNTPYEKTQYYPELHDLFGDDFKSAFIHNPTGNTWFTDPAYYWFRDVFFEMVSEADCQTFNCTRGGILHGDGITDVTLEEFVHG